MFFVSLHQQVFRPKYRYRIGLKNENKLIPTLLYLAAVLNEIGDNYVTCIFC